MTQQKKNVVVVRYSKRWDVRFPGDEKAVKCYPQPEELWMRTVKRLLQDGYGVVEINPREGTLQVPS